MRHWSRSSRKLALAACAAGTLGCAVPSAHAVDPERIVSINACADQLLLALARPEQIMAVTRYVDEPSMSYFGNRGRNARRIAGSAEEVLKLNPDLVLAGRFTRRETRERLTALGVRVELLKPARTLQDVRDLITRIGTLLGREDEARSQIAAFDNALETARKAAEGLRVLQLQRRGFVAGGGTLFDAVLAHLGGENAVAELGQRSVRRLSTEALVKLRPDAVVMFRSDLGAVDQGAALLLHPALRRTLPAERLMVIDMNTIVCGGAQNIAAIHQLERALSRIVPRT